MTLAELVEELSEHMPLSIKREESKKMLAAIGVPMQWEDSESKKHARARSQAVSRAKQMAMGKASE